MSFDMFVQRFRDNDAPPMRRTVFHNVFGPYIDRAEPEFNFFHLRAPDGGEADIHARLEPEFNGMMINHFSAGQVLDLVVAFARAADAVIMPVGCPTCVINAGQIPHLPEQLRNGTRLVGTGADLAAAIADG